MKIIVLQVAHISTNHMSRYFVYLVYFVRATMKSFAFVCMLLTQEIQAR